MTIKLFKATPEPSRSVHLVKQFLNEDQLCISCVSPSKVQIIQLTISFIETEKHISWKKIFFVVVGMSTIYFLKQ